MTKKTKKELIEENQGLHIGVIILFIGFVLASGMGIYETYKVDKLETELKLLQEDYDWLKWNADSCFRNADTFKTECSDTTECIFNPDLEGCHKNDCNSCCNNMCTVMACDWEIEIKEIK